MTTLNASKDGSPDSADAQDIYDALRTDISSGELQPGTSVPEMALASRFGVSRTPIREALRRLQQDRLLVRGERGRGLVVRNIDPLEVVQVYDLRIMLEGEAAARAAASRTVVDVVNLEGLLARDRGLTNIDSVTRARTNLEFHAAVWAASHNSVLEDLLRQLTTRVVHVSQSTLSVGDRWEVALDEHAKLIAAIDARDAELARTIAADHMRAAREIRLTLLRESAGRATQL